MTLDNFITIVVVAIIVQAIWIIWFTTAIADMQRSLQYLRQNASATAFDIERMGSGEFAAINDHKEANPCGQCWTSVSRGFDPRPVAYLRRHDGPRYLCIECAEKEHRKALQPWDSEKEKAAVVALCAEAGIDQE